MKEISVTGSDGWIGLFRLDAGGLLADCERCDACDMPSSARLRFHAARTNMKVQRFQDDPTANFRGKVE